MTLPYPTNRESGLQFLACPPALDWRNAGPTKADNLEGNYGINQAIARVAYDYQIPLWNFWASVQDLPNHGLTEDGFHLTLGNYMYNDPVTTRTGWSMRNLTALQALDAVRRAVSNLP